MPGPNLVINGSFETPTETQHPNSAPPPGNWGYEKKVPGWQTNDPDKDFEIWRDATALPNHPPCYSIAGKQNLEILAHTPTGSSTTVWQMVKTRQGAAYRFSFAYTPRPGHRSSLTVAINGAKLCTFDVDGTTVPTFNWMRWSVDFIAARSATKLSFTDARHPNGGAGTHIDDVQLRQLTPKPPHLLKF